MASVKAEPVDNPGLTHFAEVGNENNINYLQKLISPDNPPEVLEKGVKIGVRVLESLKIPLKAGPPQTAAPGWLKAINDLEGLAKPSRTIVGVVGNTGAGKSSVISAVLDEERYDTLYSCRPPSTLVGPATFQVSKLASSFRGTCVSTTAHIRLSHISPLEPLTFATDFSRPIV